MKPLFKYHSQAVQPVAKQAELAQKRYETDYKNVKLRLAFGRGHLSSS